MNIDGREKPNGLEVQIAMSLQERVGEPIPAGWLVSLSDHHQSLFCLLS